jgi:hypothetical protein
MTFFLSGCNGNQLEHAMDKAMIATSGNKPPASFKIANLQTMKDYVFDMKGYTIALPSAKEQDFSTPNGWQGFTHYNKDITLYLEGYYHITTSTSYKVSEYGERERAIVNNDITSLRTRMPKKVTKRGEIYNITLKTIKLGKEDYSCIVRESSYPRYDKRKISYGCHKLNSSHTKVRDVAITLTYNKPKNPTLAKQYTYQDLQERAKRMLDSLYIKDGWSE